MSASNARFVARATADARAAFRIGHSRFVLTATAGACAARKQETKKNSRA